MTTTEASALRQELRARPDWREIRCQRCDGGGLVVTNELRHPVAGDGTVNSEPLELATCPACSGVGVPRTVRPRTTLNYHHAVRLAEWQFLQLGILSDFADDNEYSRVINAHAFVWFDETPTELFRAALAKAGISYG